MAEPSAEAIQAARTVCLQIAQEAALRAISWALAQAEAEIARLHTEATGAPQSRARIAELEAEVRRLTEQRHDYAIHLEARLAAVTAERDQLRKAGDEHDQNQARDTGHNADAPRRGAGVGERHGATVRRGRKREPSGRP